MDDLADGDGTLTGFWALTQRYARVGNLDAYFGQSWSGAVPPPAYALDADPAAADAALDLVLSGDKTAIIEPTGPYDDAGEALPRVDDLAILLDGAGRPKALIKDTAVRVVPLDAVTLAMAAADGGKSLEDWLTERRAAWGIGADDAVEVVYEGFRRLYP